MPSQSGNDCILTQAGLINSNSRTSFFKVSRLKDSYYCNRDFSGVTSHTCLPIFFITDTENIKRAYALNLELIKLSVQSEVGSDNNILKINFNSNLQQRP